MLKPILLVEDNPHDLELTLVALARSQLANEVVVVRDGAEALDYLLRRGEFATGVLYIEPDKEDFISLLGLVYEPLASLPLERVRPPKAVLDEVMESLR